MIALFISCDFFLEKTRHAAVLDFLVLLLVVCYVKGGGNPNL